MPIQGSCFGLSPEEDRLTSILRRACDALFTDLRFALRGLALRPAFALTSILCLALGIGASTALFSVVNGVVLKSVPGVTRPERLVQITQGVDGEWRDLSLPVVRHLAERSTVFEQVAAAAFVPVSVTATGEPTVVGGMAVTSDYFDLLGVVAARGRLFTPDEATHPTGAPVAVVTDQLWRTQLGGAADAVGRGIRVNGAPVEVVGILPPEFTGHSTGLLTDVFLPLGLSAPGLPSVSDLENPRADVVEVVARMRSGVDLVAAETDLSAAVARYLASVPTAAEPRPSRIRVEAWGPLPGAVRGGTLLVLGLLSVLVAVTLAMACTNVVSMLLVRGVERRKELAVRRALGASEGRVRGQLIIEALVLFGVAGLLGALVASWSVQLLTSLAPRLPIPGRVGFDVTFDRRVLAFALVATFGVGLLASLAPSIRAGRFALDAVLRDGGGAGSRSGTRLRSTLAGFQVAAATCLLIAAALLGGALTRLEQFDPGWNASGVEVADFDLELRGADAASGRGFYASLLTRARAMPGVRSAALATKLPLGGCSSFGPVQVSDGRPAEPGVGVPNCLNRVTPGYLDVLELRLVGGRDFDEGDRDGAARVAIVNETLARRLWPGLDPLEREFRAGTRVFRVVGVAVDAKYRALTEDPVAFYYLPLAQWYNPQTVLHVRVDPAAAEVVRASMSGLVRSIDPYLPFTGARSLDDALDVFFVPQRIAAWVSGMVGLVALLLAGIGVQGVSALVVSGRKREIGIRMALGATPRQVAGLVLRQSAVMPAVGIVVGCALAFPVAILARSALSGVTPGDPIAFLGAPALVALGAALATLAPVRKALRASPLGTLREE